MAFKSSLILLIIPIIYVNGENITTTIPTTHSVFRSFRHTSKVDINGYCNINKNCSHNAVCVDNYCRCQPNHRWNPSERSCEKYDCRPNEICELFDPNRICTDEIFFNECKCKRGYIEDQINHKCRKFCYHNYDCDPKLFEGETNNMVCLDHACQCKPNYRWNINNRSCEYFECSKDSECWGNGDENRDCISGICQCNYQEDLRSRKCYLTFGSLFRWKNYHSKKETLLLCTIFIIPTVLSCCIYSYYRKRKRIPISGSVIFTKEQLANSSLYQTKTNIIYPTKQ